MWRGRGITSVYADGELTVHFRTPKLVLRIPGADLLSRLGYMDNSYPERRAVDGLTARRAMGAHVRCSAKASSTAIGETAKAKGPKKGCALDFFRLEFPGSE
jgi:hypothetical protein